MPNRPLVENIDTELAIRMTGLDPEPWDAGAIVTILSELAETPGFDWTKPLGAWSREAMVEFLLVAMRLIQKAMIARDLSDHGITRKSKRKRNRATGQCRGRWTVNDAGRDQRRDRTLRGNCRA